MEIRINISDELVGMARSRGMPIEKYIEENSGGAAWDADPGASLAITRTDSLLA
jgi:hypothetical protein